MKAELRPPESHGDNYTDPIRSVVRLHEPKLREPDVVSVLLGVVMAMSAASFVTASLATPIVEAPIAFLIFVSSGMLLRRHRRIRRRGWRRARAKWVGERPGCSA